MTLVALEQTSPRPGALGQNTADLLARSRRALGEGAEIVVFPELASSGYTVEPDQARAASQELDGPLVGALSDLLAGGEALVAAGYCERSGDDLFNSVVLVGADGPILNYRKLHLFDAEQESFAPGETLEVVSTTHGTIGICVCYDLRFVEVMRVLALKGADLVLAPAAWVAGFDANVPASGVVRQAEAAIVQANLNQVAVVAVSQAGEHPGVRTLGGSVAVDAYGDLIAGPLSRTGADQARCAVDLDAVRASRERSPRIRPRADRRTDVYAVAYGKELW